MAKIQETLSLADHFSSTFGSYIQSAQRAASSTSAAQTAVRNYQSALNSVSRQLISANAKLDAYTTQQEEMVSAGQQGTTAFKKLDAQTQKLSTSIRGLEIQQTSLNTALQAAETAANAAASAKQTASESINQFQLSESIAETATKSLTSSVLKLAASFFSIQGLKKAVDLSDTLVSTRARLDRMNDGLQTTQELETMIYESANRSRGSFMDTMGLVSQLGTMAGDAFNNTQEVVQFAEQLNKQLALSGASGQSAQAAILQLEQGLASGVLRGDELNSVMEQAPALAKSIADYMHVSVGELRSMGSEGKITADIVKNALFAAAEETNAEFAKTPMTWAQVWTVATNMAIRAMDPLLSAINWVANNIETVAPIVLSLGAAFVVFQTLTHLTEAWTTAITLAKSALALLSPQGLAIAAIAGAIYAASGGFVDFAGTAQNAAGIVMGTFAALGAWLYNSFVVPFLSVFTAAGNFVKNVFNDPVSSIEYLFFDLEISVLKVFQNIADGAGRLIGMIPGLENNFATNFADYLDSKIVKTSRDLQYAKWSTGYKTYYKAPKTMDLDKAYQSGYNFGSKLDISSLWGGTGSLGNYKVPQAANVEGLLGNIDKNTSKIAKTVDLSDEQLKMLVDVAERKYINNVNLTSQTPTITIYGQNTGSTEQDARNLADTLRDTLLGLMDSGSTVPVG